jgi:hypothetical protein
VSDIFCIPSLDNHYAILAEPFLSLLFVVVSVFQRNGWGSVVVVVDVLGQNNRAIVRQITR